MSIEVLLLPQGLLLREATKDQDRSYTVPCLLSSILKSYKPFCPIIFTHGLFKLQGYLFNKDAVKNSKEDPWIICRHELWRLPEAD